MNLEQIQIVLFDLYDIRDTLSRTDKEQPKSEGSDETIGEALDNAIDFMMQLEEVAE